MFELAWPWVLLALPVPYLVWFFWPACRLTLSSAVRVPYFHVVCPSTPDVRLERLKLTSMMLWFLVWALMLLALSGPRWVGKPQWLAMPGYNIMLALDLSPSMGVNDMSMSGHPVSRFSVVQHTAEQFVRERVNDQLGLILFGERAYLLTPLTSDHQTILARLDDASVGLAGKMTAIGDAVGMAIKHLQHVPREGRVVIVLTDGVNNAGALSPMKAAELARAEGIKLYTIGLGADAKNTPFEQLFLNPTAVAELDEETLKKMARLSGGEYFRATDLASLHRIYQQISQLARSSQESTPVRPQHEYYPWALLAALCLWFYLLVFAHRT